VFRAHVSHPEFGYADTSNYSFSTFMAFAVCGVVAGAINFAIFNSEAEHDPIDAMALAPAEARVAMVPIGHPDGLTVLPASPPAPIAVSRLPGAPLEEPKTAPARTETSVGEETAPDAASAAVTPSAVMPAVTSEKPQQRVHRASRRHNQYSYTSSYGARSYYVSRTYSRGGYRLPGFW
jgi:hypothetical protein